MKTNILESDVFAILRKVFGPNITADDCGVMQVMLKFRDSLVKTSDATRGRNFSLFRQGILNHFDLGYYLVVANLSDIAAMGAKPLSFSDIFRWGPETTLEQIESFFEGVSAALQKYRVPLSDGDVGSYEMEFMTGSAIGYGDTAKLLRRSGAQVGDLVCITGDVGTMNAAFIYFNKPEGRPRLDDQKLAESWKRPQARIAEGLILSGNISPDSPRFATSCMDTSDGVRTAIMQLSAASDVGFTIWGDSLPHAQVTVELAQVLGVPTYEIQLGINPDFELLCTIPVDKFHDCQEAFKQAGLVPPIPIGVVDNSKKNSFCLYKGQDPPPGEIPGTSWNHQGIDGYLSQFKYRI